MGTAAPALQRGSLTIQLEMLEEAQLFSWTNSFSPRDLGASQTVVENAVPHIAELEMKETLGQILWGAACSRADQ